MMTAMDFSNFGLNSPLFSVWRNSAGQCLLLFVIVCCRGIDGQAVAQDSPDFLRDVRPILSNKCLACHGADEHSRKGDLRLDIPSTTANSDSAEARAIVPGHPDKSELIARITSADPELKMPPMDSGRELSPQEIEILKQWISSGAVYETHWSFVRPVRPEAPVIDDDRWSRNEIDRFILKALRDRGLDPQTDADPYTLIRRVSLDLTGVPPTAEQADAFAADPSEARYEAIVDQLLQSSQFGEHWARMWLDLARYADTKGYEKDQPREIWRYRDWVINALNSDMPFDQFTIEQLAGDLLPDATTDQILATAFHRNTMTNDEGGTDDEEFRLTAVKDRVDTTVQVWMGLTMGCAKCHTHKYDPISQQEYYQFMAYFNQTEDADRYDDAPRVLTPTADQTSREAEILGQIAERRKVYEASSPEFTAARREWEKGLLSDPVWRPTIPLSAASENGSALEIQAGGTVLASGTLPQTDIYHLKVAVPPHAAGRAGTMTAIRLEALNHPSLPKQGPGRNASDPNFVLSELLLYVLNSDGTRAQQLTIKTAKADFSQDGWDVSKSFDGNSSTGWAISPRQGQPHVAVFELTEPVTLNSDQHLKLELSQQYSGSLLLGHVRFSVSSRPFETLKPEFQSAVELASVPVEQRSAEQERQLDEEYRRVAPETAPLWKEISQLQSELDELKKSIPKTPVMKELPSEKQRVTRIHVRGNFLEPGETVYAALPAAFGASANAVATADDSTPVNSESPAEKSFGNRLDVARWLVSDSNPLTSRVMVNRIWARIFGRGLVETEEDFGTQGALPTHPELLDWLAVEYQQSQKWSLKQLCRTLVMSSAYRQSSVVGAASRDKDPDNRWLSRGTRYRLTAEAVRDQALAAAGLLSPKVGGPSVMPPQPDGIWRTTYSTLRWETPATENRYRRGIYTFLRRTSPYPSMITFDAGSREVCMIRRIQTNTPLQALVTMNDPVYLEAAGALASKTTANLQDDELLQLMFRRVLIRPANHEEMQKMRQLLQETMAEFRSTPDAAIELLKSANLANIADPADTKARESQIRLAATTVVASVILNLDEALMRH